MERPRFEIMVNTRPKEQKEKEELPKIGSMKEFLMRLREVCPDISDAEIASFKMAKPLFKGLSPEKRVHARNVSLRVARMLPEHQVILGALLHDTQEQIPKEYLALKKELPQTVADLVDALSEDASHVEGEENAPFAHLKAVLPTLSSEFRNRVILIKLADRLDNLQKRRQDGKIPKGYRKKSKELIAYLESEFRPNESDPLNELVFRRVKNELAQLLTPTKEHKERFKEAA
ncbi:hypothetical protein A3E97_03895 [Candidatus Uhrbacteria bacterium RIFCSPHIGHO2_12_FULL_47_12]|uniref:HD domain-containing protein n=1 Tax=Candidatus Uhrbacteria bacterium RIFCSPLOWO2_02_FULL_48_18 TaxID=1802408 RepID=A0A1F7V9A9_9BACT|nr:MAG: hypothetical protein A2839_03505 [Candidatus Uhrbacteria bacterium RIFCSPHIGHO2_01_FULL_47_10]OGL75838.1 MAG: hypothetical protein A3E97_03895 [Candidatus Uhrbacteria bacterium RIFCSPHIGHO2_12_FULL_47_12]OGL81945.1 MAG: hypothetical protein A3B20_02580 [Candidatus Uhrbacteria bacterium RIFCSPLOWO2_01_FULL_47_17]OGL87109.1 MAG: hypothetical protein A3I41_04175 [Candidatus Uhrbacteria bacterium RIFCSPLOWO2_02_FULL_48_18]OGL93676.1 MAG: hypothetical protein A3H12_03440 [Candidatus Uhrbacte